MNRKLFYISPAILILIFFFGCATTPTPSYHVGVVVCRYHEADKAAWGTDDYGKGEVPAVKVMGYGGKTIHWDVMNIESGQVLFEKTEYVPEGKFIWWPLKNLAPGSYQARLRVHGNIVDTYTFSSGGVGSNQQKYLRAKKKDYFKIDDSSKWYIDKNIILENVISDETKSIYSAIIQDSSISIKSGPEAREHYIEELKKIDFQQSPAEFKEAYMRHINAWQRNSKEEIESTWSEIKRIALKYGIRKK